MAYRVRRTKRRKLRHSRSNRLLLNWKPRTFLSLRLV